MIGAGLSQYAIGSVEQINLDQAAFENVVLTGAIFQSATLSGMRFVSQALSGYKLQTVNFIGGLVKWL